MKTEDIKTWVERLLLTHAQEPVLWREESKAKQSEIDDLRAALKERDEEIAEMATPEQYHEIFAEVMESRIKLAAQRAVMKQALDTAEKGKAYAKTLMMNQEKFDAAITALKEALK